MSFLPIAIGDRPTRSLLLPVLAAIVALAWVALWWIDQTSYAWLVHRHAAGATDHHHGGSNLPGSIESALFLAAWLLMVVAMMLPTTVPLAGLFQRMVSRRGRSGSLLSLLFTGYLCAWLGFGVLALGLLLGIQKGMAAIDLSAQGAWLVSAGLFLLAGAFQFSAIKYACLDRCRTPAGFLISHWHGRHPGREAFNIGWQHGLFCVGCCWALMLLMFAVSTANLAWMLVLAAVMAVEKNTPWGRRLGRPLGFVLVAVGVGLASYSFRVLT